MKKFTLLSSTIVCWIFALNTFANKANKYLTVVNKLPYPLEYDYIYSDGVGGPCAHKNKNKTKCLLGAANSDNSKVTLDLDYDNNKYIETMFFFNFENQHSTSMSCDFNLWEKGRKEKRKLKCTPSKIKGVIISDGSKHKRPKNFTLTIEPNIEPNNE